ncbi:hypothetical protein GTV32_13625 [Gordonia sp. SID5947]|uniref:hypothetical protein n=1 Tax=Gordonia sp. SID5947 TaxID=2690315 RepID=UPI0013710452|nr:hypothetical protein [Gordonia sp. SID5947]MYR07284.1 hypothetical protein [Gordonia sp. SID5947]
MTEPGVPDPISPADPVAIPRHMAVSYLKERVYATFTGLALVLVMYRGSGHHDAAYAFEILALGVFAVVLAGFAADGIAYLAVHRHFPTGRDLRTIVGISTGALGTLVFPLVLITLAWLDILELDTALLISGYIYIGTLALIGWLAVRKAEINWWQKLAALFTLVLIGFVVLAIQVLAHSH